MIANMEIIILGVVTANFLLLLNKIPEAAKVLIMCYFIWMVVMLIPLIEDCWNKKFKIKKVKK